MNSCFKLRLLIWKNWLIFKNRKLVTFFEIFLPAIFAIILVLIRLAVTSDHVHYPVTWKPFDVMVNCTITKNLCIHKWKLYYSPNNSVTDEIIKNLLPQWNFFNDSKGFANENLMVSDMMHGLDLGRDFVLAAIVFEEINVPRFADATITYKLRFPYNLRSSNTRFAFDLRKIDNKWFTQMKFPLFQIVGPRRIDFQFGGPPDYMREGFLMLQYILDKAITSYFTKDSMKVDLNFNMNMQRMSYPPYIDDKYVLVIQQQLPLIIIISFIYCCFQIVKDVVEEKEKKLKESMKLMGLYNILHWISWSIKYLILISCSILVQVVLFCLCVTDNGKVINQSNPFIIFLFLLTYGISIISFSFFISTLFSVASTAAAAAGAIFFTSYIPYFFLQQRYLDIGLTLKLFTSFIPNVAMAYGCQIIGMFEGIGSGIQFSNMFRPVSVDDNLSLFAVMLMLIVDSILYFIIALYIEAINPGDYGVPKHFLFPFKWCGRSDKNLILEIDPENIVYKTDNFGDIPSHLEPSIQISNLTKIYKRNGVNVTGLNSLNMTCYRGEITSLLGHNGAGKTTTMSILTGFITATKGQVLINGLDLEHNLDKIRYKIGFCPQHNILFDHMTVLQHLTFFSNLRDNEGSKLRIDNEEMLQNVGLLNKKNALVSSLSGGMKRMLSIALALVGSPDVIILDEPTSGMDVEHRRQAWNLLQRYKDGRTILISTHHLDEADLLSDRIIILSTGSLMCAGSPLHLKNKYGNGYKLTVVKFKTCRVDDLTRFVAKFIAGASVERVFGCEVVFNLPYDARANFVRLFKQLDKSLSNLQIMSYGVSTATIGHIFLSFENESLKLNGLQIDNPIANNLNPISSELNHLSNYNGSAESTPLLSSISGFQLENKYYALFFHQFIAMTKKRILYTLRNPILTLSLIIIPVFFTLMAIIVSKTLPDIINPPPLTLNIARYGKSNVLFSPGFKPDSYSEKMSQFYADQFIDNRDVAVNNITDEFISANDTISVDKYLIDVGLGDISEYTAHYLIALDYLSRNLNPAVMATLR